VGEGVFRIPGWWTNRDHAEGQTRSLSSPRIPPDIASFMISALDSPILTAFLISSSKTFTCPYDTAEGVIDARGVSTATTCSMDPWSTFNYASNKPPNSTVLLPAGTITTATPWALAQRTRLVGQGSCPVSGCGSSNLTTIKACDGSGNCSQTFSQGNYLSNAVLQMGSLQACPPGVAAQCKQKTYSNCNGVVIEHLRVDTSSLSGVRGIENDISEELLIFAKYSDAVIPKRSWSAALRVANRSRGTCCSRRQPSRFSTPQDCPWANNLAPLEMTGM